MDMKSVVLDPTKDINSLQILHVKSQQFDREMKKVGSLQLVLHDGVFHADDLLCHVVAQILSNYYGYFLSVRRTRDASVITSLKESLFQNFEDLLISSDKFNDEQNEMNVYLACDVFGGLFDHHQQLDPKNEFDFHHDGIPRAAIGRLWQFAGPIVVHAVLKRPGTVDDFSEQVSVLVDQTFISLIDAADNGCVDRSGVFDLSRMVRSFMPAWDEDNSNPIKMHDAYHQALTSVLPFFIRVIENAASSIKAIDIVAKSEKIGKHILLLKHGMPWQIAVRESPELQNIWLIISPNGANWNVQKVNTCKQSEIVFPIDPELLTERDPSEIFDYYKSVRGLAIIRTIEDAISISKKLIERNYKNNGIIIG